MADPLPTAPFPTPPPFYKHFTRSNLTHLRRLRREAGVPAVPIETRQHELATSKDLDILSLPPELRYLIPPEPPSDGKYTIFGNEIDPNAPERSLADRGVEQLYPAHDSIRLNPQLQLTALSRSLLTTFLALTGILSQNPELYEEKVHDINTIALNIHDLINQYRPHHAREMLIFMMEERVQKMKQEIADVDNAKIKVLKLLQDVQNIATVQAMSDDHSNGIGTGLAHMTAEKRRTRQRAAWTALKQEMG